MTRNTIDELRGIGHAQKEVLKDRFRLPFETSGEVSNASAEKSQTSRRRSGTGAPNLKEFLKVLDTRSHDRFNSLSPVSLCELQCSTEPSLQGIEEGLHCRHIAEALINPRIQGLASGTDDGATT